MTVAGLTVIGVAASIGLRSYSSNFVRLLIIPHLRARPYVQMPRSSSSPDGPSSQPILTYHTGRESLAQTCFPLKDVSCKYIAAIYASEAYFARFVTPRYSCNLSECVTCLNRANHATYGTKRSQCRYPQASCPSHCRRGTMDHFPFRATSCVRQSRFVHCCVHSCLPGADHTN